MSEIATTPGYAIFLGSIFAILVLAAMWRFGRAKGVSR
jgi:hypothetical protein